MDLDLTLGLVTDIHFGPEARFEGKLRKLTHHAGPLLEHAVACIDRVGVDAIVNLGDDIEDESHDVDLERYRECQRILRTSKARVVNVVGNHDEIHLGAREIAGVWRREGPLHYAFDLRGWRVVVLHTVERQGVDTSIDAEQLRWLSTELAAAGRPVVVLMHHSASEQDLGDSQWFAKAPQLALLRNRTELRAVLERSGVVRAVFNGHLHRNHVDVIRGIPYFTLQSLIENIDDDAPGRAAGAYAIARLSADRVVVRVHGQDRAAYQVGGGGRS